MPFFCKEFNISIESFSYLDLTDDEETEQMYYDETDGVGERQVDEDITLSMGWR